MSKKTSTLVLVLVLVLVFVLVLVLVLGGHGIQKVSRKRTKIA